MGPSGIVNTMYVLLVLFASLLFPGFATAGVATEVVVSKSVLINLQKPSERVSLANPAIAELVVISPTQLQIIGTRIGTTSLIVWEKGGKTSFFDIRVIGDISLLETQIREVAPNDSITVHYANDTIVLAGKAANERTIARVVLLAKAYAIKSESSAAQDAGSEKSGAIEYASTVSSRKQRSAMDSMTIDRSVQMSQDDPEANYKILNLIQVDAPQQVLLEVKVAQVDKTALKDLGVSAIFKGTSAEGFTNMVGAPVGFPLPKTTDSVPGRQGQGTGIAGNVIGLDSLTPLGQYQLGVSLFKEGIGAVLKALVTKNLAKMLAEPNLLVKSGQNGNFLAGQKIPVSVVTGVGAISGTTIQYIDVGVKINFKPEVMESGLISLAIDPAEVSNITGYLPVNGYPIIDTREVRTNVQLKDGESLVLAGLLQEETVKIMSKIPLAGDIPILGALFRSTHDDIREKELVFFITPKLVNANAPGSKTELPTDKPLTPEQEDEFKWIPGIQ